MKPLPGGILDTVISYTDGQIRPIAKPLARATCPQRQVTHITHTDISMTHSNKTCEQHSSFLNYENCCHHALLSEYIDLRRNPTYVILDSGCTGAMGSKFAIDRLVRACQNHPNADLVFFTKEPSQSRFSFANGQQSSVHEKLVIHFRNDDSPTGWVTTAVVSTKEMFRFFSQSLR